jgi:hypothetical protein
LSSSLRPLRDKLSRCSTSFSCSTLNIFTLACRWQVQHDTGRQMRGPATTKYMQKRSYTCMAEPAKGGGTLRPAVGPMRILHARHLLAGNLNLRLWYGLLP